jgi:hypothetical protein
MSPSKFSCPAQLPKRSKCSEPASPLPEREVPPGAGPQRDRCPKLDNSGHKLAKRRQIQEAPAKVARHREMVQLRQASLLGLARTVDVYGRLGVGGLWHALTGGTSGHRMLSNGQGTTQQHMTHARSTRRSEHLST